MARITPEQRIDSAHRACRPCSAIGAHLLARYREGVSLGGCPGTQEGEVVRFREVCRLVEEVPFETLSVEKLLAVGESSTPSETAARRRRQVVHRLLRLLQHDGVLPSASSLRAARRVDDAVAAAPANARPTLARWLARRRHRVGPNELAWEARALTRLESVLAKQTQASERDATTEWMQQLVRQVVACACPPVTRHRDPDRCSCCGATTLSHGTRPSPTPAKQDELLAIARKYLAFRRDDALREAA